MSRPVLRFPGSFYLLSRRVDRREFRLRPGQSFENAVGLLIARAARVFGIQVVHFVVMSNHLHVVFWDPDGVASDFMRMALSGIARLANHEQGRSGQFWQQDDGRALKALRDLGAVIDAVAYCYLNPTKDGLVEHPSAWPGLNMDPALIGTGDVIHFERSDAFFAKDGPVSSSETLTLGLPEGIDAVAFRSQVAAIVAAKVAEIQAQYRAEGRAFLGREAIVTTDIFDAPERPQAAAPARQRVERVGARDAEVKKHAVEQLLAFEREYAECKKRVAEGCDGVIFPAGTYHLWRHRGFQRQATPPPERVFQAAT